jgi:hypothetical protein
MVIDEIGRSAEVSAVATVKARGVRMVASAHGSFKDLYHNAQLKGLLGTFVPVKKRIHTIHTYSAFIPPARHSLYVCTVVVQHKRVRHCDLRNNALCDRSLDMQ